MLEQPRSTSEEVADLAMAGLHADRGLRMNPLYTAILEMHRTLFFLQARSKYLDAE